MSTDGLIPPCGIELDQTVAEGRRQYLERTVQRLAGASPVPVTSTLVERLLVAEALIAHASATGADLIVMTTHGRGPLSRFWLGGVSDELVRRATVPVLLVRPQETAPDLTSEPVIRHFLIPPDGSALAERVLEPVVALGTLMDADYVLLRVFCLGSYAMAVGLEPHGERLREEAQGYLDRVAERLRQQGCRARAQVVPGQQPATAILDQAGHAGADGIALETRGRRGLTRLLPGSVADKVIRGTPLPLLMHRWAERST